MDTDSIRHCGICCGGFSFFAIIFLVSGGREGGRSELSGGSDKSYFRARSVFSFLCVSLVQCCSPPLQLSVGGLISGGSDLVNVDASKRSDAASACNYGALIYFITFLLSLGCFFGPMFIKRNVADVEALRAKERSRRAGGQRNFD
jgi:hypothetical protein